MDTNIDLEIMSHVGHLRTIPECVRRLWIVGETFQVFETFFCMIFEFLSMS